MKGAGESGAYEEAIRELHPRQYVRTDAVWMAAQPLDRRLGTEAALARVVSIFGAARPHHARHRAHGGFR